MQHLINKRNDLAMRMNTLAAIKDRSTAQTKELDAVIAQFDDLSAEIDLAQSVGARAAKLALRPRVDPIANDNLNAFVRNVATNPDAVRAAAAATYAGEGTAADGGYLAPTEYSRILDVLLKGPESLLGLCDNITALTNSIVLPVDEDAPWSVAGIAAANVAEGTVYGPSKPVFKSVQVSLAKYGVLVPVSEELLTDGVNVGGYVAQKSADKLQWKINVAAFAAFMASGAKIVAAKTTGAAVGSAPDIDNVLAMFGNVPTQLRDSAVWLANPRLQTTMMTYVIGQMPVFVPGGSLANAPNDMLLGKRIIWSELCSAVGTEGDLALVAPKAFYAVTKGAPQAAVSTHLYFDADQIAYKTSARVAIKSKFSAPITRPDSTTVGNVATLATR